MDGDAVASSTAERHRFVYVEHTSPQPQVTFTDGDQVPTSGDSLVIVVDMTERSPSRHAGRPINPTVPPSHPPSYRLLTTRPAPMGVAAVADGGVSAVAERVAINVGLIVGIVGAVSTLMVMLAALLLCRPRQHVPQSSAGVGVNVVDDRKVKLSATSNGDGELYGEARHNIAVEAMSSGLGHRPARFESAGTRVSAADEWFV